MVEATIFILAIIPVMLFLAFGIPIIVGVLVYRDANKRVDCSPWLWALIAALVPSFIGLIIYAIIRRDYPLKNDGIRVGGAGFTQGGASTEQGQTYEAHFEQRFDEEGNPIPGTMPVEQPHRGFPTWAKVLLILGAILVVGGMITGCGTLLYGMFTFDHSNMDHMFYYF